MLIGAIPIAAISIVGWSVLVLFLLALAFALGLTIASIKLRVEQDPRIDQVEQALPGANCGGCGMAGCAAFAKAVVLGKAPVTGCPVGGPSCGERIAAIMGVSFEMKVKTRPVLHCVAGSASRKLRAPYHGSLRCSEANLIPGVQGCAYGCLGLGDCIEVCKFGALRMEDGLPIFDYAKCTSCGACVTACPRGLIELIPFKNEQMLVVGCSSRDPGKVVRQVCDAGCLGCGACARKSDVFAANGNLACIDYTKYTDVDSLKEAFAKCPAKALVVFGPTGRIPVKDVYAKPSDTEADRTEEAATPA